MFGYVRVVATEEIAEVALNTFHMAERAELLGAIFGDGCVEQRGHRGQKVSVAVSDEWPRWLARVPALFDLVFGRWWRAKKKRRPGVASWVRNFEFHLTTHDLPAVLGIAAKYDSQGRMVPPAWVEKDPELLRRFIRGLVETDGCFSMSSDAHPLPRFSLSQKNDYLTAWFVQTLRRLGYPCWTCHGEDAGVNLPSITQHEEVRRFGEWVQSEKWEAVRDGHEPRPVVIDRKAGGIAVRPRERKVLKTIPIADQERWRVWRSRGASIVAIARHVGRSNNVVWSVVRDIVPARTASAESLGLRPRPSYPRAATLATVDRWREAALAGKSSRQIAKEENARAELVVAAVADIRWDQAIAKRRTEEARLARMMSEPEGDGRWTNWSPPKPVAGEKEEADGS